MAFDFLTNEDNAGGGAGGSGNGTGGGSGGGDTPGPGNVVESGSNIFYDGYQSHFDAHRVFSTPPISTEFNLPYNFDMARDRFSENYLKDKIRDRPTWFGEGTEYEKLINGYTQFADPELLADTISGLNEEIPASLFSGIEKPKMRINDRFGMFSFDLASMAMTYVYEYYTKKGKNKVDANFVFKAKGKFYELGTNKEVEQQIKRREDGTPVVVSSVRNCLIDFEKKNKNERAVEIFITSSYSWMEQAEDIIYNSMAAISVAQNLVSKGFKVKITAISGSIHENKSYYHLVPVKRFDQPLDINAVAYVCGDPRFTRYQGFKMLCWGYDQASVEIPGDFGSVIGGPREISNVIENHYVPYSKLEQADTRLYFGGSRSLSQTSQEVTAALEILNDKYREDEN